MLVEANMHRGYNSMKAPTILNNATLKASCSACCQKPVVYSPCRPEECQNGVQTACFCLSVTWQASVAFSCQNLDLVGQLLLWSLSVQYFLYRETISSDSQWICSCSFKTWNLSEDATPDWVGAELLRAQDNFQMLFFLGLYCSITYRM